MGSLLPADNKINLYEIDKIKIKAYLHQNNAKLVVDSFSSQEQPNSSQCDIFNHDLFCQSGNGEKISVFFDNPS